MARLHLIWTVLAGLLFNQAMAQAVDLGPPAYTLSVSPQPRKISVLGSVFIGISGCQVVTSPIGNPGAKTLTRMDKTFDQNCDVYYISEAVDLSHTYLAIDGKGVLSIFHFTSDLLSYSRTTFYQIPYTAYYYPRVYKMERIPNTNIFFVAALQTNIIFKVMVEPGGLAELTKYLTNERSQSYETMAATNNNRLVTMSASGQYMELWDTTTMSFITLLEFSPFVFGNIYRSVAYYPIVSQQDFIMAPKTGLVAHFIDLTNKLIVYEFAIKQENPEFCYHVPQTNYFAVMDPANIDFLNVLNPSQSKTFAVAIGQSMDTIGAHFFTRLGTGYLLLTFSPGGAAAGRVYDLGTNFCHVTCATCAASLDPSRCTSCQIGYTLNSGTCTPITTTGLYREISGATVSVCPAGEYATTYNSCKACSTDCSSCRSYSGFCLTCLNSKRIGVSGNCITSCEPSGQFLRSSNCQRCHPTCATCSEDLETSCQSCPRDTSLASGKCVPTTPCQANLSFHWIKLACLPCTASQNPNFAQSCQSCTYQNLGYSCNQCTSPYVNEKGNCVGACGYGTIPITASGRTSCLTCEESESTKTVFYGTNPSSCISPSECPSGFEYSGTVLTCVRKQVTPQPPLPQPIPQPPIPTPLPYEQPPPTTGKQANKTTNLSEGSREQTPGYVVPVIVVGVLAGLILLIWLISKYCSGSQNGQQTVDEGNVSSNKIQTIPIELVRIPRMKKMKPKARKGAGNPVSEGFEQLREPGQVLLTLDANQIDCMEVPQEATHSSPPMLANPVAADQIQTNVQENISFESCYSQENNIPDEAPQPSRPAVQLTSPFYATGAKPEGIPQVTGNTAIICVPVPKKFAIQTSIL